MTQLWYSASPRLESKKSESLIHPFVFKNYRGLTVNPYQGCQHRCAYCYATYEWSPEFYDRIYAKSNAAEVLERQLAKWKGETIGPVMVSSATDCYQPAELRFELTRKCVKVLQKYGVPYYVFTKSALVERDLELHKSYKDNCLIIWSITTCNEKHRRVIEPGTPPSSKLFATIRKFSDEGICCAVNVDPIIPLVTDNEDEIGAVVESCKSAGLKYVFGSVLRLRADIWDRMKLVLQLLEIPDGAAKYKEIYDFEEPVSSNYVSAGKDYSDAILLRLRRRASDSGITASFPHYLKPLPVRSYFPKQTTLAGFIA
jgi:DNA repair photolyase